MKQFLRYTLTLVAILIATTNAWAAATCHTVTKTTFETTGEKITTSKNWLGRVETHYFYYFSPADQESFTINNDFGTISNISFTATGDKEDDALEFKVIYQTANNSTWIEIGDEYPLVRYYDWGWKAPSTNISLNTSNYHGLKDATKIGIRFTKFNSSENTEEENEKRTITISNVSVTFSPYFQSDANNTTLEAFPSTEKGNTCSTTRSFSYKYNNTVTSVNWVSSNPMFTVSSTHTDDCSGEKVVTITFKPTEIRSEITGTITGTDNNGNKIVVYVKGSSWGKEDPTYTWKPEIWNGTSQARTIYVGETINDMLSYTSSPANCTYTIEKLQDYGINNGDAITTFTNNTLVAGRAGKYKLTVSQPAHSISATSGYNAGETTITLDVVKKTSSFTLNFANEYYVDDEINKSTFFTDATNSEVAIQVSDKTADNRALFTYNGSILKANGATLNADSETTTITVTQPENYKWTSYTQEKAVIVKKYTTEFSWLLQPTYLVGEEITSIFNKSANGLPSTIISSDPTIVKVENNQLIALRAGKVTITVSQAVNRKWVAFTHEKEITIVKRNTNFQLLLGNTYYVDDQIGDAQIYSKVSENTLPVSIVSSNNNILEYDAANHKLIARNAGKATITVSQAKDTTWTHFDQSIEVTVLKHNIVATITPDNAFWNELIRNPFAATSKHPVSGQVTKIDNFNVEQQGNEHIALMNTNTRDIQTYYTNGTVDFLITRDEDYKYNALSKTLTLTVNANENGCTLLSDPTHYKIGLYDNSNGVDFTLPGIGDVLTFQLWKNTAATQDVYVYGYNAAGTQVLDKKYENSSITTNKNNPNNCSVQLSEDIVKIKIKAGGTLNKHFKNLNITRAQYIRPTEGERALSSTDTLKLPTVAIDQPSSQQFNLKWSACTDIKIVWNNPKFSISTTNITARDGSQNITITCNTSEIGTFTDNVIIYNQEQMETFPISCKVYTKWITDSISGSRTRSMKVDESWNTDFYFPIQRASQYPTTDGAFHFAIEHTFKDENLDDRNPNNPDEVISYNNGVITAHNAGTAILTIQHDDTPEHFASQQFTCTLTVSKHDAELNWKDPVYYNDTISNYFTTTDTISPIVIVSETDTDVAKLTKTTSNNSLDLITYNKEASTTVTVSQAENYKWNGYSKEHTITPIDPNNHVTFTIDSQERRDIFDVNWNANPYTWDNGIQMGDWLDGGSWADKYVDLHFTGIPDKLTFNTTIKNATNLFDVTDVYWYVKESTDGVNWSDEIWNEEDTKNITITDSIQLHPDSRYLRLCYSGNFGGVFHNIHVTELNEFRAVDSQQKTLDKDTLDFGANQVYTTKTRTFDLRYANPGYKITVESTDPHFTVTPDFIDTIGGENHGTLPITVSYTSKEKYAVSGDAMIIIKDEIGHADTVRLYASSDKAQQVLHWRSDFEAIPQPIIRFKNGNITDAAWATSQLPVTFTSNNESVIQISDDGKTLIPVAEGETEITANQVGNEMWLPATPITKTFIVTDKLLQYIIWEDDLTNIIKEDINPQTLPLTAQVYLQQEDNSMVFSQEQTDSLVYKSANDNIVSAADTTLTVKNIGKTTLTVSVGGNVDYAPASLTKPVIVRSPALGCEDDLLYQHEGDPIQFFQMNLDEVISKTLELDRTKGIPGYVNVAHEGKSWDLVIQYYAAEIRVEQSLDNGNSWNTAGIIQPEKDKEKLDSIPLSREATHIRFVRNVGGQGYQFLNTIDVHPAQYIEARDIKAPHDEITVVPFGEIHVGSSETRTFLLDYSNIKHSLSPVPSTSEVTATPSSFSDCNGFGRQEISVTWLPTTTNDNATETITFTDPNSGMEKVVTLTAKIIKGTQLVVWTDRPTTIQDCGTITFPKYTTAHLPITWKVVEGNEYADFNEQGMLEIYKNGTIKVQATQEGNDNYNPLAPVSYTFNIQLNITFVGTEGTDWNNPNNWAMCRLPLTEEVVTIAAPAELSTHDTIKGIIFSTNSSIHITHTGGLTINEAGVTNAATDGSSITIDNNPQGAGFLRISPSAPEANKHPYFTMDFTTRAFNEGVPRDETWQYMGAPGNNATFKDLDSQTLIYHWDETKGWTPYTVTGTIPTWQGYALTQSIQANHTYQITAQAIQGTKTIDLTYTASGMKGDNLFVNSFTAPIDITKIDSTTDVTGDWKYKTFYFFNTGSWNDWQGTNPDHTHDDASSAGHYYAVPLFSAPYLEGSQTIVPPMQGVYVHTDNADVSITLDYTRHVWNGAAGNLPMRAPQKQSPDFRRVRIQVSSDNSGADRMYIIQESSTTRGYDNGYDGKNINAKGQVNIYTNEPFGKMEVSCANNIDSMYIGLRTGSDTHYTLTFGAVAGDSLYLQDLENDSIIPIFDDEQYHFTAEPNAVNNNRFLLLSRPHKAPNGETSTPETDGDELTKIWSVGKVIYIANAPANSVATLYTVGGHLVLSNPIANTQSPAILDVSYLPEGVYILRLNDQVYKFVCK